jgi:two-component system CheB/CheR fusion protein
MKENNNLEHETGDLVVIGSSAGGIEALTNLVNYLPEDFPAPIVLAQHLDPNRSSSLETLLQRRTVLKVISVTDQVKMESGNIYVVPSNIHIAITGDQIEVQTKSQQGRPIPSVDLLFSTAAKQFGERLIAVILTGTGSDGAAGAVEVKNAGGTIIVQNPRTASYPSMPMAIPPSIVDFEVDIERIGLLMYELLKGINLGEVKGSGEELLKSILELVRQNSTMDFRRYKTTTIIRRIRRRMTVTHCRTMGDYRLLLDKHPEEIGELAKAFLINVTQFFRDFEAFEYLKKEILPVLIKQGAPKNKILRFWSAGCATGEEPYSLAMYMTDLLGAQLPEWSIKIFATDVDEAAIEFARRGLFTEAHLQNVPPDYRERFFEQVDQGYRISKTLRQMVIFGHQDLSKSAPFPRIDLVLCRNVLIYFTPQLQESVFNQFSFSINPNGYLFLGKAETVRLNLNHFEQINKQWKIYRRSGKNEITNYLGGFNLTLRSQTSELASQMRVNKPVLVSGTVIDQDQEGNLQSLEVNQLRRFNELLLRFLPVGIVVIDRNYQVLTINGMARRLLGLREAVGNQDFLHAVRGIPYAEMRQAIDMVFREHNTATLPEVELDNYLGGASRYLSLSIARMQVETGNPELAAISVYDITDQVLVRRQLEVAHDEQNQLMSEISAANRRLNDMNKELLDSNEELQVANEELVLTHEELQATIEEFETTNEELQATNEELETNNEELQATNEELQTTNEELRARSSELHEVGGMLDIERFRLFEIIQYAPFLITVLHGPQLQLEAFNYRQKKLVNMEQELHQNYLLKEVSDLFGRETHKVLKIAREVYQQDKAQAVNNIILTNTNPEDGSSEEKLYCFNIVPSHNISGKVEGVIIYAIDEKLNNPPD